MLDLATLRKALAPLSLVGKDELTFDVKGTTVTIRPLLPAEEVVVQRHAAEVLEENKTEDDTKSDDDNMSRAAALDYFDRFRIEIMAYSLVQVGSLDLRQVGTVTTGEILDNGVEVSIPKHVAMRLFIREQWSRGMLSLAFYKYGELAQRLQIDADNIARKSASDLDVEIERVEKRLEDLKEERTKRAKGDVNITNRQIASLLEAEDALDRSGQDALDRVPTGPVRTKPVAAAQSPAPLPPEEFEPELPPIVAPPRRPVTPASSPPPSSQGMETVASHISPKFQSSFDDSEEAIMEEEQRILARRRLALRAPEDVKDPLAEPQPTGPITPGGPEAYRLPQQTLSSRGKAKADASKSAPAELNPIPKGTGNPNFRPSR